VGISDGTESYVHKHSDVDHERLIRIARLQAESAKEACLRAGLVPGSSAIDIGCGPLGALLVLHELIGPTGFIVGLDKSAEALAKARSLLEPQRSSNYALICADINNVDPLALMPPGPFDFVFCRLVLIHQTNPLATLRKIARLVRPGGRIVVQDSLDDPTYPRLIPSVPAIGEIRRLHYEHMRHRGASPDVARRYSTLCDYAGLNLIHQRGFFFLFDEPSYPIYTSRTILENTQNDLVGLHITNYDHVNSLLKELTEVDTRVINFSTSTLYIEMIAELPDKKIDRR